MTVPGGDGYIARRSVLGGGAAVLAAGALPLSACAGARPESERIAFATDIRLPGLLYAAVARPPLPGWRLAGADAAAALRMMGVVGVIPLEPSDEAGIVRLGGAALLARDTWTARRARDALLPAWEEAEAGRDRAEPFFVPGTAEPLMEPPSATARAGPGGCEVWTRASEPAALRRRLAGLLGLTPEAVVLHPAASACGQGPANPAYAVEAALLSRAMGGAAVSLAWTVEDDLPFHHRPALT